MYNGYYQELVQIQQDDTAANFGFLESVDIKNGYSLYDYLHGRCDEFAAALSDFYGYSVEAVIDDAWGLIHAYCVTEIAGHKIYIDARGITDDDELFFSEFTDFYIHDKGKLFYENGIPCRVECYPSTRKMYSDEKRELNQDKDLVQFFKDNNSYYDIKIFAKENYMSESYKISKEKIVIPDDKIMIAVLDYDFDCSSGYPEEFTGDNIGKCYICDTPEEFIAKWHTLDEGAWYWVFADGEEICSGAVDPADIEIFEEYFDMSLMSYSEAVKIFNLPERVTISASALALDTDDIYEDKEELSDIISDYLSDSYGFCHYGFDFDVIYNELNEPSDIVITNIKWDVDKDMELEEMSTDGLQNAEEFRLSILAQLKEKGFDVSQIKLSIEQFIDKEHKNCIWYDGTVATVEYKNHVFWLEANGDVSVTWLPQAGFDDDYYDYDNKNVSGAYHNENALDHFVNDAHLAELDEAGRLVWQDNNWFEVFVETSDGVTYEMARVCNTDDLEECIFEMIEDMDLTINDLQEENSKIASVDAAISQAVQSCEEESTTSSSKTTFEIEK